MEAPRMRRSQFRKCCILLVMLMAVSGGYYVYQMKIKSLYDKYEKLLKEQEEYEKKHSIDNILNKHGRDHPPVMRAKGKHEIVNGVDFFIDQQNVDPNESNKHFDQNKGQNDANQAVDDNGNNIPDDDPNAPFFKHGHRHEHHVHHEMPAPQPGVLHKLEKIESDGENRKEREMIGDVEVIVEHNGQDASVNNPKDNPQDAKQHMEPPHDDDGIQMADKNIHTPIDTPGVDVDALQKVHQLMDKYRNQIKAGENQGAAVAAKPIPGQGDPGSNGQINPAIAGQGNPAEVGNAIPVVVGQGNQGGVGQVLPAVKGNPGAVGIAAPFGAQGVPAAGGQAVAGIQPIGSDEAAEGEALLRRLGFNVTLNDDNILDLIMRGQVKGPDALKLMKYHSKSRLQPPPVHNNQQIAPPLNNPAQPVPVQNNPQIAAPPNNPAPAADAPNAVPAQSDNAFNQFSVFDTHQEADATIRCVPLKLPRNSTMICINDPILDKPISQNLAKYGVWEGQNVEEFQKALEACPQCGVIDLGANLGVYSLTAAKAGRPVLAVEPLLQSIAPFHKAIQLNKFTENITLLRNAMSDKHGYVEVKFPKPLGNLGSTYVVPVDYNKAMRHSLDLNVQIAKTITLDDLPLVLKFKKAVLKVDISGSEHVMFNSTKTFLKEIDIPFIFMHWAHEESKQETLQTADILLRAGYKPKITIGGPYIEVAALTRDQGLLIWAKQYANARPPGQQ